MSIFAVVSYALGAFSKKKSLPIPMSRSIFPMFSSSHFIASGLPCKSLIHFELNFITGGRRGLLSFCTWISNFPSTIYWRLSFSQCIFLASMLQISWFKIYRLISRLCILFRWNICLFICPAPFYFDDCSSVLYFEVW